MALFAEGVGPSLAAAANQTERHACYWLASSLSCARESKREGVHSLRKLPQLASANGSKSSKAVTLELPCQSWRVTRAWRIGGLDSDWNEAGLL